MRGFGRPGAGELALSFTVDVLNLCAAEHPADADLVDCWESTARAQLADPVAGHSEDGGGLASGDSVGIVAAELTVERPRRPRERRWLDHLLRPCRYEPGLV